MVILIGSSKRGCWASFPAKDRLAKIFLEDRSRPERWQAMFTKGACGRGKAKALGQTVQDVDGQSKAEQSRPCCDEVAPITLGALRQRAVKTQDAIKPELCNKARQPSFR